MNNVEANVLLSHAACIVVVALSAVSGCADRVVEEDADLVDATTHADATSMQDATADDAETPPWCSGGGGTTRAYIQPGSGTPFRLGDGLESYSGSHRPSCLESVAPRDDPASGQVVSLRLVEVGSFFDLTEQIGVSIAAKFNAGAWSGAASAGYMRASRFSEVSRTFVVRVSVQNATQTLARTTLSSSACGLGAADFRRLCGDSYVNAIATGGEFIAVITYVGTSALDASQFAASLSFGTVTGSASVESSLQMTRSTLMGNSRLSVDVLRRGGAGALPDPHDVGAVLDYALDFPDLIANTGGDPVVVSFTTQTYPQIVPSSRGVALAQIAALQEVASERALGATYVLSHPEAYAFPIVPGSGESRAAALARLDVARATLAASLIAYERAADACLDPEAECASTLALPIPVAFALPRLLADDLHSNLPGVPAAGVTGGCQVWSPDESRCLRCLYVATEGIVLAEQTKGLDVSCEVMPPSANTRITGAIGILDSVPHGSGGTQLLQATLSLEAFGSSCSGGACRYSNVHQNDYPGVSLVATGTSSTSGSSSARISSEYCFNNVGGSHCSLLLSGASMEMLALP